MQTQIQLPTKKLSQDAHEALRSLRELSRERRARTLHLQSAGAGAKVSVELPREIVSLFLEVLAQIANGNAVSIVPVNAELTTQQAADILNVSRPHLVALLEREEIPFRKVGTHRRIRVDDLLAFRQKSDADRADALSELSAEAQKLGLGY